MRQSKGFTLIELLIVIAVLGILVVAILSALDPLEQIRKARDAGRKSDAAEMLAAYERYFTTYQCYPWDINAPLCAEELPSARAGVPPDFTLGCPGPGSGGVDCDLIYQGELKAQFRNRRTIGQNELYVSTNVNRNASVCYEPEARASRQGGQGQLMADNQNQLPIAANTCANPGGYPDLGCFVCVPQ